MYHKGKIAIYVALLIVVALVMGKLKIKLKLKLKTKRLQRIGFLLTPILLCLPIQIFIYLFIFHLYPGIAANLMARLKAGPTITNSVLFLTIFQVHF